MLLCFVAQNLGHGALRAGEGLPEDRWPAIVERITSVEPGPDFVLLTEASEWDKGGHRQLAHAMSNLDMDTLGLAPS